MIVHIYCLIRNKISSGSCM